MANKPRITLGLPDHPRCRAMIDGKVGVEGYELDIDPNFVSSGERHYKYLHGEWDVGECSAATLLRDVARQTGRPFDHVRVLLADDAPVPASDDDLITLATELAALEREVRRP